MLVDQVSPLAFEGRVLLLAQDKNNIARCRAWHLVGFSRQLEARVGHGPCLDVDVESLSLPHHLLTTAGPALFARGDRLAFATARVARALDLH